jgi:hypothetical protein
MSQSRGEGKRRIVREQEKKALKYEGGRAVGAGTGMDAKGTELYAQVQAVLGHAMR